MQIYLLLVLRELRGVVCGIKSRSNRSRVSLGKRARCQFRNQSGIEVAIPAFATGRPAECISGSMRNVFRSGAVASKPDSGFHACAANSFHPASSSVAKVAAMGPTAPAHLLKKKSSNNLSSTFIYYLYLL